MPSGYLVHAADGRARLRFPSLRGAPGRISQLAERLSLLDGVVAATPSPLTGSIVVRHRGAWPQIAELAAGIIELVEAEESLPPAAARLPAILSLGLGALAVLQLFRGQVLPPAVTLLWYASTLAAGRPKEPS